MLLETFVRSLAERVRFAAEAAVSVVHTVDCPAPRAVDIGDDVVLGCPGEPTIVKRPAVRRSSQRSRGGTTRIPIQVTGLRDTTAS